MNIEDNAAGQTDPGADNSSLQEPAAADSTRRKGRGLGLLALILAVAALAVAALSVQRLRGMDGLQTSVTEQQLRLDEFARRLDGIDTAISGIKEQSSEQSAAAETTQEELKILGQTVMALRQRDAAADPELILAEVEQLLILASHHLSLDRDAETALTALGLADRRLALAEDPRLAELRGSLAAEMNAIRSVNRPDIPGMSVYLADLVTRVDQLPLKQSQASTTPTNDDAEPAAEDTRPAWRRLLDAIWGELRSLLVISTAETNPADFLPPEQRYFLTLNLRLQLETARLSLLLGDTENFQSAVTLADNWIKRYFSAGDAGVAAILESLELMHGIELRPDLPDLGATLTAARTLREELRAPNAEPAPGN
jgi:uncharacterized protein HemX